MLRMTGSALPRAFACPGSLSLPMANTRSKDADDGTSRHAEQADAVIRGDLSGLPAELAALIPAGATVRAEVAVAYDVSTGTARELGVNLGRAYGQLGPFEIPTSIDLAATAPGFLLVADHKGYEEVDPPDKNEQVLFEALCAHRLWGDGLDSMTACVSYLPTTNVVRAELDVFALDLFAARLRQLHLDVADQGRRRVPDVAENKHCKYCPAAAACPAKTALLRRLVDGTEADELLPMTEERAALAYERLGHAKRLLRRIEDAVFAYARDTPVKLRNGNILGPHRKLGNEQLDGDVVHRVLLERFGRELADAGVKREASKTQLERALKVGGVAAVATVKNEVLAEVRKRGGATRKETVDVCEYPPERAIGDGDAA